MPRFAPGASRPTTPARGMRVSGETAMAEVALTPLAGLSKAEIYQEITRDILAVLEGEPNRVARMATCVSLLSGAFDNWFWTGFYMVDESRRLAGVDELVVGPYNGTLGCLR